MECGENELIIPVILATIVTAAIVFRRWKEGYDRRRFWRQLEKMQNGEDRG